MGQPANEESFASPAESIGRRKGTWGTETSQYPEEEKSNEIPGVVASETGGAQTHPGQPGCGVVGCGH
jgi:hypothetical protein